MITRGKAMRNTYPPIVNTPRVRGDSDFIYAIRRRDNVTIRRMIAEDNTIIYENAPSGMTTLMIAIQAGYLEIIKLLLESGAKNQINATDSLGNTALLFAIESNSFEAVKLVIENRADVNQRRNDGTTPLMAASKLGNLEIMRLLVSRISNLNQKDRDGETVLHIAARSGNLELIRLLIDSGADVNQITTKGLTPLYVAAFSGHLEVVKLLVERGSDVNKLSNIGANALYIAASKGYVDITRYLIEKGSTIDINVNGFTALHAALFNGFTNVATVLMENGADINMKDANGFTPLHHTVARNTVDRPTFTFIIEHNADLNIRNNAGNTPLTIAAMKRYTDIVTTLLEHGATVTQHDISAAHESIKPILEEALRRQTELQTQTMPKWKGFTKSDMQIFDSIFDRDSPNAMKRVSACPVCLKYVHHIDACNYMSHNCSLSGYYHKDLYNKYKNDTGLIYWCTICGRICLGHRHYALGAANEPKPALLENRDPFAADCRVDNGGGVEEKIIRFRIMRSYAAELQSEIDKIPQEYAMNELVEAMWMPSQLPRVAKRIITTGAFNVPLNAFSNNAPPEAAARVVSAPPGSYETPEVLTDAKNSFIPEDSLPVIRFKHKNKNGVMTRHEFLVNKDTVLEFIRTSGDENRCFEPACKGLLYPEEIEAAFADPAIADSITDADREILAAYKERFYRNYVGGRRRKSTRRRLHKGRKSTHRRLHKGRK